MQRGIEPVGKSVNRELVSTFVSRDNFSKNYARIKRMAAFQVYNDSSTSRSKQTSPLPAAQRDVKYIHAESSSSKLIIK